MFYSAENYKTVSDILKLFALKYTALHSNVFYIFMNYVLCYNLMSWIFQHNLFFVFVILINISEIFDISKI